MARSHDAATGFVWGAAPRTTACRAAGAAMLTRIGAMVLIAMVATIGCVIAAAEVAAPRAPKNGDAVRVTDYQMHQLSVAPVELYPFRVQKFAIGQIAFNEDTSTAVLAPFSGRVVRLIAKVGDKVKRGESLFEIDSPEVVQPQNDFIAAATALNKARSQHDLAIIVEKRLKDLYEGKAAALKEWQQAEGLLVAAKNDMRSAGMALEAARARLRIVGFGEEEIATLQTKGTIRRATPIVAPIDGTVIARKVGPGQYVRNDTGDALYVIADLSTMWLKAQVPENDIPLVRVDQEVEVKVSALPRRVFNARIANISASTDLTTRRTVVRSEIPNHDGALKSEMFASFKIATGADEVAPAVPSVAVIREGDVAVVWVQEAPALFRRRAVTIGMEQEGRVQIREGLKPGELIVARGAIFVDNEWRQQ
jgi:cobalt-zinc-cadmium efflux system membrane fusion protein